MLFSLPNKCIAMSLNRKGEIIDGIWLHREGEVMAGIRKKGQRVSSWRCWRGKLVLIFVPVLEFCSENV